MSDDGSGRRANTFTDLLRFVHDAPGIERIRFATSHPRYFTGGSWLCVLGGGGLEWSGGLREGGGRSRRVLVGGARRNLGGEIA